MQRQTLEIVKIGVLVIVIVMGCAATSFAGRDDLGRSEKLRIMVDKVMHRSLDDEGVVKETAAAGFNVICPRSGGSDLDRVRNVAQLAEKYGIYHMVWMRGTKGAQDKPERVRYVWPNGHVSNLYSPNSDEFWEWTNDLIINYAKISAEEPALIGVFLDYEVYDRPKFGNGYTLSYDLKILEEFAASEGIELPELKPAQRKPWLKQEGLHKEFEAFQVAEWRRRCRALREAVDEYNPQFQFCIYPIPGSKFEQEAACREWATQQAPIILGESGSYGQRLHFESFEHALNSRWEQLVKDMQWAEELGIPFMYVNGLDPAGVRGDPEHFGRSAVMISQIMDGYWVFYEGPDYATDHKDYFRWFKRGNQAIVEGNYAFWQQPRETPVSYIREPEHADRLQFAEVGIPSNIHSLLAEDANFEIVRMAERYQLDYKYLENFDVVALQSFNGGPNDPAVIADQLRKYVAGGGGLLLAHDLSWFGNSPFPRIASLKRPPQATGGHATLKGDLQVISAHEALGLVKSGTQYSPVFPEHYVFDPGPEGTVLIQDEFGNPVYVVGTYGEGRVIFSGSFYPHPNQLINYYGRPLNELGQPRLAEWQSRGGYPAGTERELLLSIVNWLAGK